MLKNQKFGVEIEFTGITRRKAAGIVAKVLGCTVGSSEGAPYFTRTMIDSQNRGWKVMRDSSIVPMRPVGEASDEYRVEFVTPPLRYEDIETVQEIIRAFRKAGAVANHSCGIHIHVDGANHTAPSLRRLVKFFSARQQLVYMPPLNRRKIPMFRLGFGRSAHPMNGASTAMRGIPPFITRRT